MTPAVQRFFDQVSSAYQTSPLEVIIAFVLVFGLITALVVYAAVGGKRSRRRQIAVARKLFEEKADELGLTPSQRELLERMRHYLKDDTRIHLLVTDEIAFSSAAAKVRENEEAGAQSIAALRVTLGFHGGQKDRAPRSSAAIPTGATVLIARNRYRRPIKAKVLAPQPEAFRVRITEQGARLPGGAGVDVFYQSNAGVFTFRSTVLGEERGEARLAHSEDLKRYQKRRYYRRQVEIPVRLYPFDADKELLSKSRDIGGGGASLLNPDGHFKAGDDLELRFRVDDVEIKLTGSVVRVSDSGRTIHVNYEHIRDSVRDRIYQAIFKPPADEVEAMEREKRKAAQKRQGAKTSE